jgi:hypothetical protein
LKHISKQTKSFGYWNISPRTIPSDLSLSFLWLVSSGHRGSSVGFFHSLLAWFTLTFGYVTEPRVRTWCLRCSLFFFCRGFLCLSSVGTMTFLVMSCIFWGGLDMVQGVCMLRTNILFLFKGVLWN